MKVCPRLSKIGQVWLQSATEWKWENGTLWYYPQSKLPVREILMKLLEETLLFCKCLVILCDCLVLNVILCNLQAWLDTRAQVVNVKGWESQNTEAANLKNYTIHLQTGFLLSLSVQNSIPIDFIRSILPHNLKKTRKAWLNTFAHVHRL